MRTFAAAFVYSQRREAAQMCLYSAVCAQSCPTLCDSMDCSPPSSSMHGIFQARILKWDVISFPFSMGWTFPTQGSNPRLWHLLLWQADSLPCAT